ASITLVARNESRLQEVRESLDRTHGQEHDYLVTDFASPEQVRDRITAYLAEHRAEILVNNTGGPSPGPALEAKPEEYIAAFNAHLICNQVLVQALVPQMMKAGYGRIINIISTSVKIPIRGLGVSNTIRGAVA